MSKKITYNIKSNGNYNNIGEANIMSFNTSNLLQVEKELIDYISKYAKTEEQKEELLQSLREFSEIASGTEINTPKIARKTLMLNGFFNGIGKTLGSKFIEYGISIVGSDNWKELTTHFE